MTGAYYPPGRDPKIEPSDPERKTTPQKQEKQKNLLWRLMPTRLLMQFFRHIDKQESPTLTHTVAHVVGSLFLVGVPALTVIFWQHIPAAFSFLFGSESQLRQSISIEVWQLSSLVLVALAIGFWMAIIKMPKWIEKGAYWESRIGSAKYCGVCRAKNKEWLELKYVSPNLWECLKCQTRFSPHGQSGN